MNADTVTLNNNFDALEIIDQTLLPQQIRIVSLRTAEEIYDAIKKLRVRGAPAIGVAAAGGAYLVSRAIMQSGVQESTLFMEQFLERTAYLASARPTAVNLSWALDRMNAVAEQMCLRGETVSDTVEALRTEAVRIKEEDISVCRAIGEYGLSLLHDGMTILTHCNAGRLAAVRYGTALAPIYVGKEKGLNFKVYADETRPLLQGARLTAFELQDAGIDVTLICDNMAASVMKSGKIDAVITGCDRMAANGDAANKIGTCGLAVLANHFHIPLYIAAPVSTIDPTCANGSEIVIEERDANEIAEMWYKTRMAPEGIHIYNPSFDVTDQTLISAVITEKGVLRPPYDKAIAALFKEASE